MTSRLYCVDANFFITSWNANYPIDLFPRVWSELVSKKDQVVIIEPIFDEIDSPKNREGVSPAKLRETLQLRCWLAEHLNSPLPMGAAAALAEDLRDCYDTPGKGASMQDLCLIAYAKLHGMPVVTLELPQTKKPLNKRRYKIPAICEEEGVDCINTPAGFLRGLGFKG